MKKLFLLFALCASIGTANATEGALKGKFTINAQGDQIVFSQGNLQYNAVQGQHAYAGRDTLLPGTWQFAPNQYSICGTNNQYNSAVNKYDGWVDLFGWGTSDIPFVITGGDDWAEYVLNTNDWGVNAISNGGNEPNLWRTLTGAEWQYVIFGRKSNHYDYYAQATVCGQPGLVLLPDEWTLPDGLTFRTIVDTDIDDLILLSSIFQLNVYDANQWEKMESAGAVFFPAAGYRRYKTVYDLNQCGYYWASDRYNVNCGWGFAFDDEHLYAYDSWTVLVNHAHSIRLVQAAPSGATALDEIIESSNPQIVKIIKDGQLFINRNGEIYNAQGARVE